MSRRCWRRTCGSCADSPGNCSSRFRSVERRRPYRRLPEPPNSSPNALGPSVVERIVELRTKLSERVHGHLHHIRVGTNPHRKTGPLRARPPRQGRRRSHRRALPGLHRGHVQGVSAHQGAKRAHRDAKGGHQAQEIVIREGSDVSTSREITQCPRQDLNLRHLI